jgi:undecaprenyl-diphosphatase
MRIDVHQGFWKLFTVFIQIGAILAVVVYFWKRIWELALPAPLERKAMLVGGDARSDSAVLDYAAPPEGLARYRNIWLVLIGTIPVLVIGKLVEKTVDKYLESPKVVAAALAVGGLVMILIEMARPRVKTEKMESMS